MHSKMLAAMLALVASLRGKVDEWFETAERRVSADMAAGRMMADNRAQTATNEAGRAVGLVVALTVGGIVAAFLLPVAIDEIVAVDTSSWSSGATSLWDILDIIMVLAVFLFFIAVALAKSDRM